MILESVDHKAILDQEGRTDFKDLSGLKVCKANEDKTDKRVKEGNKGQSDRLDPLDLKERMVVMVWVFHKG